MKKSTEERMRGGEGPDPGRGGMFLLRKLLL